MSRAVKATEAWLEKAGFRQGDLAKYWQINKYRMSRIMHGGAKPTPQMCQDLQRLSKGAVPALLWLEEPEPSGATEAQP